MTWQLSLAEPAGGPEVAALVDVSPYRLTRRLDGPDQLRGVAIDGRTPAALELVDYGTDILARRDGDLQYRGRVTVPADLLTPAGHTVALDTSCYRWLLHHRALQADLSFAAGTDEEAIGWGIIDHIQSQVGGDLGITRDGTATGTTRQRNYVAGSWAGQLLDQLGRVQGGPEWDITPDLVWRAWPTRGGTATLPLVWGSTIDEVPSQPDARMFANAVYVTGDDTTTAETRETAGLASDPRGRWDAVVGFPDVSLQATVGEHADGELEERSRASRGWTVHIAPGLWSPDVLDVGDIARLIIVAGRHDVDVNVRVHQLDVSIDPAAGTEDVIVHLDRAPEDLVRQTAEDRRRLTALERA